MLAESHYLELQRAAAARPNRDLISILDGDGAVLIVGMSLGDANLRRVLYQRSVSSFMAAPTYAVVKTTSSNADPYHAAYWRQRKTTLVFINDHDLLLPTLRDIQFGAAAPGELPRWLDRAGKWLEGTDNFTDGWQQLAWTTLRSVSARIRETYSIEPSETIRISLFRLMADAGELQKVASTEPEVARTAAEARAHAVRRRLNVRVGQEQGVAGNAFLTGLPVESIGREGLDLRFDDAMKADWSGEDFASLVAVPVYKGREGHWLPVGVVVLTSSSDNPFWRQSRGALRLSDALRLVREVGERLLTDGHRS
ncbi:MAG TPA: hypothetical protein VHO06_21805 [Polyangia bacterium]|nr:hypothetical protein [Polyangia bacterium]